MPGLPGSTRAIRWRPARGQALVRMRRVASDYSTTLFLSEYFSTQRLWPSPSPDSLRRRGITLRHAAPARERAIDGSQVALPYKVLCCLQADRVAAGLLAGRILPHTPATKSPS